MSKPRVIDPPKHIWLIYGDIEQDCTNASCEEVTWCTEKQEHGDVKYVLASDHDAAIAALEGKLTRATDLLREVDEYLKPSPLNYICSGSVLHKRIAALLQPAVERGKG